jgi:general secretion pathway protein F
MSEASRIAFSYEAVPLLADSKLADGKNATPTTGSILAHSEVEALGLLREQGLRPISLKAPAGDSRNTATINQTQRITGGRITAQEQVLVMRELATLLRAGITLIDAVTSLAASRPNTRMGAALHAMTRTLNAGGTFVDALEASKIKFPVYVSQLAQTGEVTGKLASCLQDAAKQMEYEANTRKELINALLYPAVLVVAGITAVLIIFMFVVPKFATLIQGSRAAKVPDISLWVINAGVFFKANWVAVVIGVALFCIVLGASLKDAEARTIWLARLSRLPLIGPVLIEGELGRWATMLGILLTNRVPILTALDLASSGLRFANQRRLMDLVSREVRGGATLADTLAKYRALNPTGLNLIRVGEKSGELAAMTVTLGELFSDAGRTRLQRLTTLIGPVAILLITVCIGFLMAAVMLAVTSIAPT